MSPEAKKRRVGAGMLKSKVSPDQVDDDDIKIFEQYNLNFSALTDPMKIIAIQAARTLRGKSKAGRITAITNLTNLTDRDDWFCYN